VTSASSRVQLDPNDPIDRPIIARQVKVARAAGAEGQDRAAVTRGRPDLEAAFDEGAAEAASAVEPAKATPQQGPQKSAGRRAWDKTSRFRKLGPGWSSVQPTSPARLPTRMSDAGGVLSGLALYTVVVIYIRYGPEGWKGWLGAKFLNKPMDATGPTGALGLKPKNSGSGKSRLV
jgi:hypothetical protein